LDTITIACCALHLYGFDDLLNNVWARICSAVSYLSDILPFAKQW